MIKYSELEEKFKEADITIHEFNIETEDDLDIPFVVYTIDGNESFLADGINYLNLINISMAIIDQTPNFELQSKVENVLDKITSAYDKNIQFDSEARLYSVTYNFQVFYG